MRRGTALGLLVALALSGCDDAPAPTPDAGSDAGAPADASAPFDPSATFVAAPTSGEGPFGVWGHVVAWLDDSTALVFGGTDAGAGGSVFDGAWRVSVAADGTLSASAIGATGPAPRYCLCMAYDAARDTAVVYGGRDLSGPFPAFAAETWELDLGTDTWTPIAGADQPGGTLGCAMAYSRGADAVYLFGGAGAGAPTDTTHRYDASAGEWVELAATGPTARYDAALLEAHDGASLYLFGGSYGASGAAFYADLWRFDPTDESWTEIALPEGPPGRRTPWVVRDPDRAGLYVGFGFDGAMMPMGDLHYADLDALTWTEIPIPFEGPVPRGFSAALPGGDGALGTVMGGFGGTRAIEESWRLIR